MMYSHISVLYFFYIYFFSLRPLRGHQIGLLSCELNQTAQWGGLGKKAAGGTAFWVICNTIYLLVDRLAAREET